MQFNSRVTLKGFAEAVTATLHAASAEALTQGRELLRQRLASRFASEGQQFGPPWRPRAIPKGWPLLH
jgi:hypothetical protein